MKKVIAASLLGIFVLALVLYFFIQAPNKIDQESTSTQQEEQKLAPILEYGIPVDSFNIANYSVERNQTLGNIFIQHEVSAPHFRSLIECAKGVFDIRSIKAGNPYKVFTTKDSTATIKYLVYEHSQVDFIVFEFADSLRISTGQHNIIPVTRISEAEITTSLWEAMQNFNLNPVLALDLSDVFAWTVDFFGLFKDDKFKAIYDDLHVDNKSIGIGTIHAAWFEHRGKKYYAFRYMQDSVWSYWDEEGNSLRKAFLKAPLRFSRISSKFSYNRLHPILKIYRPHTGVDYAAPEGTPVVALGEGVITDKGYNNSAGNFVKIKHNSVYSTGYNHFSRFGKGIVKGTRVAQGQVIGYVGKTGYATGPHLDLRFWKNGKPIDPLKVEAPPVEPIKEANKEDYLKRIAPLKVKLDSLSLRPVFPSKNTLTTF